MKPTKSITETPNELSADIDLADATGIVRILRQADAQIFSGFLDFPGLFDDPNLDAMAQLAKRAAQTLGNPRGIVVMSGAGTSGRLAMFAARTLNRAFPRAGTPAFAYLMAGGDAALVQAQEGAEDDPNQGVADLRVATADCGDVFYVGITCGYSAPYIAGQVEHMLDHATGHSVLLGFNPLELARDAAVENWHGTFREAAERLAASPGGTLLNPVVGPEPVTGSTRMKSGSATKILIEVLFAAAIALHKGALDKSGLREWIVARLRAYEEATRTTYLSIATISRLVEAAGDALRNHGHIIYLGAAGDDGQASGLPPVDAGILGLIDASECPPTYGANFEDVRGFVSDGWESLLGGHRGRVLSERGGHYRFALSDFRDTKLPDITADDLVIALGEFPDRHALLAKAKEAGARTASVVWQGLEPAGDFAVCLPLGHDPALDWGPLQLAVKLVINAVTTAGHVLAGKVFGNRMVDLRISNNKLFHRTMGIIADLMGVSPDDAREALLRSVFQVDALTDAHRSAAISECIERGKMAEKLVPKALLMATGKFSYAEATAVLAKDPIVRAAIGQFVKSKH